MPQPTRALPTVHRDDWKVIEPGLPLVTFRGVSGLQTFLSRSTEALDKAMWTNCFPLLLSVAAKPVSKPQSYSYSLHFALPQLHLSCLQSSSLLSSPRSFPTTKRSLL